MDIFELLAFIILAAGILIFFSLYYVLPGYLAYRRGKNWKKYILPSLLFGPLVIPFALYQGKDVNSGNTAGSGHLASDQPGISDISALEPGEVVTLKLSAKKAGNKGVLSFTDKRVVFDGGIGSKHSFVIPMRNLKDITFLLNTIQFSTIEVKGATLSIAKNDMQELKVFVGEIDHPQINPIKMERYPKQAAPKTAEVAAEPLQPADETTQDLNVESAAIEELAATEEPQPLVEQPVEEPQAVVNAATSTTEDQATGSAPPPPPIFKG